MISVLLVLAGLFNFVYLQTKNIYKFPAKEKLKSRKAINALFSGGESFSLFPYKVIYDLGEADGGDGIRVGFAVSSRVFKRAVCRNRIKRLMREAFRLQKEGLEAALAGRGKVLCFFIVFTGNEVPEYLPVYTKMTELIGRLQKIVIKGCN